MKNIYFAVALIFLVLLAFSACSTGGDGNSEPGTSSSGGGFDKSSSSKGGGTGSKAGACYITFNLFGGYADLCLEGITESVTSSDCEGFIEDLSSDPDVPKNAFTASYDKNKFCPSGADYKCHVVDDDLLDEGYVYLYGSFYDEDSCDEFGGTNVGGPTTPSSSSRGGTSSAGSGSQTGVCYVSYTGLLAGNYVCEESMDASDPMTKDICDQIGKMLSDYLTTKLQASCPSGEVLRCINDPVRAYYYGPNFTDETCSSLGQDDDPTAPSRPSSSSAGGGLKSSSSGGAQGACYDGYDCITPVSPSECAQVADEDYAYINSCPANYVCSDELGGKTYYYYGEYGKFMCDDYGSEGGFLAKAKSLPKKSLPIKGLVKKSLYKK